MENREEKKQQGELIKFDSPATIKANTVCQTPANPARNERRGRVRVRRYAYIANTRYPLSAYCRPAEV